MEATKHHGAELEVDSLRHAESVKIVAKDISQLNTGNSKGKYSVKSLQFLYYVLTSYNTRLSNAYGNLHCTHIIYTVIGRIGVIIMSTAISYIAL